MGDTLAKWLDSDLIDEQDDNQKFYNSIHKSISKKNRQLVSSPDACLREKITIMHLRQAFIVNGYDFIAVDRTDLLEEQDCWVINLKTAMPIKVQVKTCGLKLENYDDKLQFRFTKDEVLYKYKNITVFVLYAGSWENTSYGPAYYYRIYFVTRSDLLSKIDHLGNKNDKILFNLSDPFWIERNGNFKIFDKIFDTVNEHKFVFGDLLLTPNELIELTHESDYAKIDFPVFLEKFTNYVNENKDVWQTSLKK